MAHNKTLYMGTGNLHYSVLFNKLHWLGTVQDRALLTRLTVCKYNTLIVIRVNFIDCRMTEYILRLCSSAPASVWVSIKLAENNFNAGWTNYIKNILSRRWCK